MGFILGVITGIIISTVGISGVANVLDNGVQAVKRLSSENLK
jgi:hypothetical protein